MNFISSLLRQLLLASFLLPSLVQADSGPPNILVILTDDQGRGDYSAFGTKDIQTPNIDRIFHEGMTFENFYANSCVCSPTRAALLTGCYPDRVGVPGVVRDIGENSWGHLSKNAVLLPQVLRPAGYHSAIVGKWHLGEVSPNTPNERGFDEFHGFLDDMMDDYWTHLRNGKNFMRHNMETVDPKGHATDVFTDWACEYLNGRANQKKPFFLYLAYNAPHDPVQPKPDWLEKVRKREPEMSEKRAKLVALIEHMDSGVGKVLETLDKTGLAANTLVLFTSDNGGILANGANNGPWRGDKQHMYEGGLRVPCAVRWPGKIAPGSHTEHAALSMDIFATACTVAKVPVPAKIDGISFLPSLLGGQSQAEVVRDHYFVRREGGPVYGGKTIEALRLGDWKLVQDSPFAPAELFNMKDDPKESNNLAAKQRKILNDLSKLLRAHIQEGGKVPWRAEEHAARPEEVGELPSARLWSWPRACNEFHLRGTRLPGDAVFKHRPGLHDALVTHRLKETDEERLGLALLVALDGPGVNGEFGEAGFEGWNIHAPLSAQTGGMQAENACFFQRVTIHGISILPVGASTTVAVA